MTDPWQILRGYTQARIALGRAGHGLPTAALLELQLAHAAARDAVLKPWDALRLAQQLEALGLRTLCLRSQAADRTQYLLRPNSGRRLTAASREKLAAERKQSSPPDIALTVSNGLSSNAVEAHGRDLLERIAGAMGTAGLSMGPVCLVPDGRVALSDEIGAGLSARLSVIIVGERPGLSAADSLGIYLTYGPRQGNTDAQRNCISNIRPPNGLSYAAAADKLLYLVRQALRLGMSGVALKDDMPAPGAALPPG